MTLGELLERAMQVIVGLRLTAHRTGEVTPEMEAEARDTLARLYGAKQEIEPDPAPPDEKADDSDDEEKRMTAVAA